MPFTRRDLLSRGALLVAAGLTAPAFITRTALALDPASALAQGLSTPDPAKKNHVLVVLQLGGGNDGLNTLIPFADPAYARLRPSLGIAQPEVLKLTDSVGLHPNMERLKALYDQGSVAIVQGVGYPNPNRSHFRSMDIWHTARPDILERSGWLGRYLDACECQVEGTMPAVSLGDQLNSIFWTDTTLVPSVSSIGAYSFLTDTRYKNDRTLQLQALQNIYAQAGTWSENEALIRKGTLNALAGSDQLQKAAEAYKTTVTYPANNGLATQLKLVTQVLAGNLGTRLFSVQMGGFDTHASQKDRQASLLKQFSEAVDAFMQDLARINRRDDIILMTFSEFGRRARQNDSGGTDHGTAEPMFVIGSRVKGGLHATYPSLSDLDAAGDLKFSVDFRSVYAAMLQDHLGADPTPILSGTYPALSLLV